MRLALKHSPPKNRTCITLPARRAGSTARSNTHRCYSPCLWHGYRCAMTGKKKLAVVLAVELTAVLAVVLAGSARAETVAVDDQVMVRESDLPRPSRGMTMHTVEAKFGAPATRHEA